MSDRIDRARRRYNVGHVRYERPRVRIISAPAPAAPVKVDQSRVGRPWGNCWQACLATLAGCALEDVPDTRDPADPSTKWTDPNWLKQWQVTMDWLADQGLHFHKGTGAPSHRDCYWIALGPNLQGVGHAVVYRGDNLWHDPNPSRAGIVSVEDWEMLDPVLRDDPRYPWLVGNNPF